MTKKIPGIDRLLLNIGLQAIGSQIANLTAGRLGLLLQAIWKPLADIVRVLTDKDKDNEVQVKSILHEQAPAMIDSIFGIYTEELLSRIQDDSAKLLVEFYLQPARELIKAIADAEPDNDAQLRAILEKYRQTSFEVSFAYLIGVMEKKMPDGNGKNVLLSILNEVKRIELE